NKGELSEEILPMEEPGLNNPPTCTVSSNTSAPLPVIAALEEMIRPPTKLWVPLPTRVSVAGLTPLPTRNGCPLLTVLPLTDSVPPLNSNTPSALVNSSRSTSTSPALRTLVPRRTSRGLVPNEFVVRNVPPSTTTRFFVEVG